MEVIGSNIKQKQATKFCCEKCNYVTVRKSNFDNHLLTAKHLKEVNGNENKQQLSNHFCCEKCNKLYQTHAGLWKHKQKCNDVEQDVDSIDKDQLIIMLIKQNAELIKETSEFKNMMMEQQNTMLKVIENGTHNTTTTNSHNKTFNLQFFLNETCKDAMNLMDFVDSIKLQLSDLENVGKLGYVNGISNIIIKNLNLLDETQRPVHCTDTKREVIYVKDEDKWEKEDENKDKMRLMIKNVSRKNSKLLTDFRTKFPGCDKSDSRLSGKYDKLTLEAFGGKGDDYEDKENKIIKHIVKEVKIEKE
jgi:hypothetical protein